MRLSPTRFDSELAHRGRCREDYIHPETVVLRDPLSSHLLLPPIVCSECSRDYIRIRWCRCESCRGESAVAQVRAPENSLGNFLSLRLSSRPRKRGTSLVARRWRVQFPQTALGYLRFLLPSEVRVYRDAVATGQNRRDRCSAVFQVQATPGLAVILVRSRAAARPLQLCCHGSSENKVSKLRGFVNNHLEANACEEYT
jgi:hypothetical protein